VEGHRRGPRVWRNGGRTGDDRKEEDLEEGALVLKEQLVWDGQMVLRNCD
jgi:hypothetical protein